MAEMKTERKSVFEYLSKNKFLIPIYQRKYTWGIDECEQLWDDVMVFWESKDDDEEYFLGSIVMYKDNKRLNSNDTQILEVNIFDDAQVRGVFKKDGFFKDGAKVAFKKAGAINEIAIVGESVEKKMMGKDYDGSDREFNQRISIQIPSILGEGEAISAINAQLEKAPSFEIEADASHNFEGISSFDIEYIDEKVIVFNNYIYVYSGGAHGSYSNDAVAFSLESGERIANGVRVLLKNEVDKNLMLMIKERLQKEYGSIIDDNPYPSNFKITPEGVEFYWGLYEIAPYAAGIVSVKFSLDEIAPYIKEDSPYYYKFKDK